MFVNPVGRLVAFAHHHRQFANASYKILHEAAADTAAAESGNEHGAKRRVMFVEGNVLSNVEGFLQLCGEASDHFIHN